MVQRVIALVLAVGFVAAAIFLVPTDTGSTPSPGSAAQPVAGAPGPNSVPGAQPADPDAGVVPTEPATGEPGVGAVSSLHARSPDDPPGATSDETALKCEPLVKRLQGWGGAELTDSVGRASLKTHTEAQLPAYCDELNKLGDDDLKKAIKDQMGITVP